MMKTLEQIDAEIAKKAKKNTVRIMENPVVRDMMSEDVVFAFQSNALFGDKYREMYHILYDVEQFLRDHTNVRKAKALKKRLEKL